MKEVIVSKMDIAHAKYLIRLRGFRLEQFGTGTRHNPIKLKSKKR